MTANLRRVVWGAVLLLAACGPGVADELALDGEGPPAEAVVDDGTGEEVAGEDPLPALACDAGDCDETPFEPVDLPEPEPGALEDAGLALDAGLPDAGGSAPRVDAGTPSPWVAGAKVIVRTYASFRSAASSSASLLTSVQPAGGVTDVSHGDMPRGQLSPGQRAVLATGTRTNGFYEIRYDGVRGWVSASVLAVIDPTQHPVAFALGANVRNAYFKHQLHRSKWNKDGPWSSGTCAPSSLAMAAHLFGKEPAGLSIEESIHRARQSYGATSDSVGTSRSKITAGAQALGLSVRVLDTRLSLAAMLTRIDQQLASRRTIVLEGQPGTTSTTPTTYQQAFNRAYAAAGLSNRYTFDGRHSIFVMGKDANGRYVVGDPLSEVGMVTLTGAELKDFFARWGGTGNAVWAP